VRGCFDYNITDQVGLLGAVENVPANGKYFLKSSGRVNYPV